MGTIVCATRGGEDSVRAQDRAIALAKEQGHQLIFLYVLDLDFIKHTAAPIVVDVTEEMTSMGDFLLLMAQERARDQGVEAEVAVRQGKVREAIQEFLVERNADLLVIGLPHAGSDQCVFDEDELHPFAKAIKEATGVRVDICA
jgi:nucleotide-binding universal stress UspA family protein